MYCIYVLYSTVCSTYILVNAKEKKRFEELKGGMSSHSFIWTMFCLVTCIRTDGARIDGSSRPIESSAVEVEREKSLSIPGIHSCSAR